jgi:hypothetical protein
MKLSKFAVAASSLALGAALVTAPDAFAQQKPVGWSSQIDVSGVSVSGNSSTLTMAGKLRLDRAWLRTFFTLEGGALRGSSKDPVANGLPGFYAVGSALNNGVVCGAGCQTFDNRDWTKKAENYFGRVNLERRVTERFFVYGNGGLVRDLFAGIKSDASVRGGVGYIFSSPDKGELKLDAGAGFANKKQQNPDPAAKESYALAHGGIVYDVKFGENKRSSFNTNLGVDFNLQVSQDVYGLWQNGLTVGMSERLALQVGANLTYRNLPALNEMPLFLTAPAAGANSNLKTLASLEKLDTQVTVSLVFRWSPRPPSVAKPN